jgi:hypothetical protein
VGGDLQAERVAIARRVAPVRAVRDEEDRGRTGPADEAQGPIAERGSVDEQVAAGAVVDDVLPLVLQRLVQLEDPRTELVDIYLVTPSTTARDPEVMLARPGH